MKETQKLMQTFLTDSTCGKCGLVTVQRVNIMENLSIDEKYGVEQIDWSRYPIPNRTKEALKRYIEQGVDVGDFLHAVLTNDLFGSFGRADQENRIHLHDIIMFIHNELPSTAHGSKDAVRKWLEIRKEEYQQSTNPKTLQVISNGTNSR